MGFSQGAMLAAIIMAQSTVDIRKNAIRTQPHNGSLMDWNVPAQVTRHRSRHAGPRLALLFGAALPKPYEKLLAAVGSLGTPLPPSLHFLSRSDKTNPPEQGEWLAQCLAGEVYWHKQGHRVPDDPNALDAASNFLELYGGDLVEVLPRDKLPVPRQGGL